MKFPQISVFFDTDQSVITKITRDAKRTWSDKISWVISPNDKDKDKDKGHQERVYGPIRSAGYHSPYVQCKTPVQIDHLGIIHILVDC